MTNDLAIRILSGDTLGTKEQTHEAVAMAVKALSALPSAQPERKRGKWIERGVYPNGSITEWQSAKCSACGRWHTTPYLYYFSHTTYCPNCGADMREADDERPD